MTVDKKKKIDWNFYVYTKVDTCAEFQLSRLIFFFISCQQLLTADDNWLKNENQASELKFGTSINFSVYIKIPDNFFLFHLSSAVNSRQQLMTAVDSWWKWESI